MTVHSALAPLTQTHRHGNTGVLQHHNDCVTCAPTLISQHLNMLNRELVTANVSIGSCRDQAEKSIWREHKCRIPVGFSDTIRNKKQMGNKRLPIKSTQPKCLIKINSTVVYLITKLYCVLMITIN